MVDSILYVVLLGGILRISFLLRSPLVSPRLEERREDERGKDPRAGQVGCTRYFDILRTGGPTHAYNSFQPSVVALSEARTSHSD